MTAAQNQGQSIARRPPGAPEDCWNHIGVSGDCSCPELAREVHCRNCPVYSHAGRSLFDREAPEGYREEWTELLSRKKDAVAAAAQSVVIFTLGSAFLALPTSLFREVATKRVVHRVPGNRGKVLLGLVNIRGEIQLCVSLALVLELEKSGGTNTALRDVSGRLLVVEYMEEAWVFPVTLVHGTYRYPEDGLQSLPSTVEKTPSAFSRGTFEWAGKTISLLNEATLFAALKRGLS